jgi:hypothetical protein
LSVVDGVECDALENGGVRYEQIDAAEISTDAVDESPRLVAVLELSRVAACVDSLLRCDIDNLACTDFIAVIVNSQTITGASEFQGNAAADTRCGASDQRDPISGRCRR